VEPEAVSTDQLLPILKLMKLGQLRYRPAELLVLLVLADCANGKVGNNAYPSVKLICRYTTLDRKTVIAALKVLRTGPSRESRKGSVDYLGVLSGDHPLIRVEAKASRYYPTRFAFNMKLLTEWLADATKHAAVVKDDIALAVEDGLRKPSGRLQPTRRASASVGR
jgi:hypothetical protein